MAKRYTIVEIVDNKVAAQWSETTTLESIVAELNWMADRSRQRGTLVPTVYSIEHQGCVAEVVRVR